LYFPTVHVHDGTVPESAHFDHSLYAQPDPVVDALLGWDRSHGALGNHLDERPAEQVVDFWRGGFQLALAGDQPNQDTVLVPPDGIDSVAALELRGPHHHGHLMASRAWWRGPAPPGQEDWAENARRRLPEVGRALRDGLAPLLASHVDDWHLA